MLFGQKVVLMPKRVGIRLMASEVFLVYGFVAEVGAGRD